MLRFIIEFAITFVILVVSVGPLKWVSHYVQLKFNQNKWLLSAAIVAFLAAGLAWSSRSLQQDCLAERNKGCIDAGGAGSQAILVGGFVVFALLSALMRYRD